MPRLAARLCGLLALGMVVGWLTPPLGKPSAAGLLSVQGECSPWRRTWIVAQSARP